MFERGRNYERGLRPSLLNSPLQPENTLVYPLKQAGEGFTLKVLPEGTEVRYEMKIKCKQNLSRLTGYACYVILPIENHYQLEV
jgi:hypothetical protein